MVPDLRMAVKVGADSMSNEIRTHLETTSVSYFTDGAQGNIRRHDGLVPTFDESGQFFLISVYLIVFPITHSFVPGLQAAMASSRQRRAVSTKRWPTSSTSPTKKVSEVSPW